MNKSTWMSEEGYRNAVAKGAFNQAPRPEPEPDLTSVERVRRGVIGLSAVAIATALLIAVVVSAALIGPKSPGSSGLFMWTLPSIWETFKLGCYNIAYGLALVFMATMGWLVVMLVWERCVELGSLILNSKSGKR